MCVPPCAIGLESAIHNFHQSLLSTPGKNRNNPQPGVLMTLKYQ
ncbi:hypothetical protein SPLC1_S031780 [Arthrospira platensis C1]|nr:hypothetical protein SPLC1_S031780 [Arthrospira platensis C1]